MILDLVYDSSVASAPAGFTAALDSAVSFFESNFSDAVTITIGVGYGTVNGSPLVSGALGESITNFDPYSYAQIESAFAADAKSADDATAAASLPAGDPTGGAYWVATAEAKALGLSAGSGTDGFVGFSSKYGFDYDDSNGVSAGLYDFFGVVAHEITEVMGRQLLAGESFAGSASYEPMDLFHFSAPGVRTFLGTQAGYFSPDSGVTNLGDFNTSSNGDFGDWASSAGHDSFRAFFGPGAVNAVTEADMKVMDVIGWDRTTIPDLTVANLDVNASGVSYRVSNIGVAAADASSTGIYLSNDAIITPADTLIATAATPSLAPGGVDDDSVSVAYPDTLAPGTYYVGALADYDGQIAERSEANNASNAVAVILGNTGSNALTGTSGNDTLNGGAGKDLMIGGSGNDTYCIDNIADLPVENSGEGADTVLTSLTKYTLPGDVENLTYTKPDFISTGAAKFTGIGNASDNIVTGGTANDSLSGLGGNDCLIGGSGGDTLDGGAGNDWLGGGDGSDSLHGGDGADTESGGNGNDGLHGDDGVDSLLGEAGNDTLDGGTGADRMAGGAGNDTYDVDDAGDMAIENSGEGTDTVIAMLSGYTLPANIEQLTYAGAGDFTGAGNALPNTITGGAGNDSLDGGDGNDLLHGGAGADTLSGGNGNDKLYGEAGDDLLTGGAGADRFVFTAADLGGGLALSEIADFSHAQKDKIDLSAIDAVAGGADNAFSFIGNGAFTGVAGQLHYVVNASGVVNVEGDTNGDGTADFSIAADGISALVAGDFVL